MKKIDNEIKAELLVAMDTYKSTAQNLIRKLITETRQPEIFKIREGHYYEIQNADLLNGQENLSDNWRFDVHGEHCLFENTVTGQKIEVYLGNEDSLGNLDPYFFNNFLKSTEDLRYLALYFNNAFSDTLKFFEELAQQNILVGVYGENFRKVS